MRERKAQRKRKKAEEAAAAAACTAANSGTSDPADMSSELPCDATGKLVKIISSTIREREITLTADGSDIDFYELLEE